MLNAGGPGDGAGGDGGGLAAVFEPRRVALVGASDRPGSVGRLLWDNLAGFPGEVLPVCPAATVRGRPAYADLRDVPGPVDPAVIATPAATVPGIISAAADKGVRAVVVLSAGFAETGEEGAKLQADAVAAARAGGVRLVGPNCFGVQNADLPLNASIAARTPPGGSRGGPLRARGGVVRAAGARARRGGGGARPKGLGARQEARHPGGGPAGCPAPAPGSGVVRPVAGGSPRPPPVLHRGPPDHPAQAGH